ncbi:MFS transporter [bacterium CG17_big_fil_post_rev_8_21_14_2_50_64_8]|nr:MAG: MFS transporter [bacterium CG17_big_fil_post_rev_8_21_14_2_50_64_8]PJA73964.1 MAG: MFS transporter [bacterium CG_4_9_14_3_um_filter_65_15]
MSQGHPKGLYVCFGAEMFERLCYYGMRGLLTLYLIKALMMGDTRAFGIYGAYTAMVYAAPVWGGKLADTVLGYRRAIMFGGIVMAIGEFLILGGSEFWLFLGMSAIIIGNGYFKANISTIVGKLYKEGDPLRDSGFTIFYMGINVGALLATLVVAPIGETHGYMWGFGLAGVGMIAGVLQFYFGQGKLQGVGEPPNMEFYRKWSKVVYGGSLAAIPLLYALITKGQDVVILGQDLLFWILMGLLVFVCFNLLRAGFTSGNVQRDRIIVLMILMTFNVVFWAFFEQAGTSLTMFADRNVDREIGSYLMPASQTQFFNPAFIIIFGSIFSVMWVSLSKIGKNPNIPLKFGLGIVQLGLGFLMLLVGSKFAGPDDRVPLFFLGVMYLLHTTGELFLSPIGLSMVTKLAPKHMTGSAMGAWFLSFAFSMYVAALLAKFTGVDDSGVEAVVQLNPAESLANYMHVFGNIGLVAVGIGVGLVLLSKPLNKMMHGIT